LGEASGAQQMLLSSNDDAGQSPRDAATLIVIDDSRSAARVLMGRRRLDQVFMPGKYVFPGGRVDADDDQVESVDELAEEEILKLLKDMQGEANRLRARAIALAGIREIFEETGKIIGSRIDHVASTAIPAWQAFFASGYQPALSELRFFARAITPPGQPRRYDTRFFCVPAHCIVASTGQQDNELSDIGWYSIDEAFQLDLPLITRAVLDDLNQNIKASALFGASRHAAHLYYLHNGAFARALIDIS